MNYEFKPLPEIVRAVGLAVVVFLAMTAAAVQSDTSVFAHPATYFTTVATGLISVIGTALLGALTSSEG